MSTIIHADHSNIPDNIRAAFIGKVKLIADYLQVNPNWLMQVMYAESRLKARAQNIQQGRLIACGLLQWTRGSGVPGAPEVFLNRDHLQQLDWVKEYFKPYRGKMRSYYDVYLVTFFPAAIGRPDNYVLETKRLSAALIAKQNPAVNIIKDGKITLSEFKQYVWNSTPVALRGLVFSNWADPIRQSVTNLGHKLGNGEDPLIKAAGGIAGILAFFGL